MKERGRWYFALRAFATFLDYAIYGTAYSAYVYAFGQPNDEGGYTVEGCWQGFPLILLWVVWFPLAEGFFGRTFGKWVCDLRVVQVNGAAVTVGQRSSATCSTRSTS